MPFGLKGAPTTFQKLMVQEVLVGHINHFAIAYLDDIIIYSHTPEEHRRHLRLVFERLSQHGLRLNLNKCKFASNSLDYLGHVVTSTGNHPQTANVTAITNAEVPRSRKGLRQFLGTVNWLRDYIQGCSELLAPLADLLTTKTPFRWTLEAKEIASKPLFLHRPHPQYPFILQTDASAVGGAAVL
ncbi:Reverse transcriptase (RNA-dependent DNA polymerase) [Popillia japonica]|uniref:Reverse transcriptase (RNA-dependent DNA polymerase) n=1 Tax=Popillia japonica TaxID=7064 RepID=A0AAW1ITG7_POPJA